jgi:hypothetical protein
MTSNAVNSISSLVQAAQFVAAKPDLYSSGARNMVGNSRDTVSWSIFQWVVGGMGAIIIAGSAFFLSGIRDDISNVRKDVVDTKVEIVRAVAGVEKQIAITNGKFEQFIQDSRQRR